MAKVPHRVVQIPEPSIDPRERIVRVWIEKECLICQACETICPSVFAVDDDTARIRPGAEQWFESQRQLIEEAYDGCCVEVIRIEYADGSTMQAPKLTCDHKLDNSRR